MNSNLPFNGNQNLNPFASSRQSSSSQSSSIIHQENEEEEIDIGNDYGIPITSFETGENSPRKSFDISHQTNASPEYYSPYESSSSSSAARTLPFRSQKINRGDYHFGSSSSSSSR